MRIQNSKNVWRAVWCVVALMVIAIAAGIFMTMGIQSAIPRIVQNYQLGKLDGARVEELLTTGVNLVYYALVLQVVFSIIAFYLGYKVAVSRRRSPGT